MSSDRNKDKTRVGFWNNARNDYPQFPMPVATDMPQELREVLVNALRDVETAAHKVGLRGPSQCRICGDRSNGSFEYSLEPISKTSGGWVWPQGFAHYILEHGVRPPEDFVVKVLGIGLHSLEKFGYFNCKEQS